MIVSDKGPTTLNGTDVSVAPGVSTLLPLKDPKAKTTSPVTPVAPVTPVTPVAPVAPVEPVGPVGPVEPMPPVAPVVPVIPVGPTGPVGLLGREEKWGSMGDSSWGTCQKNRRYRFCYTDYDRDCDECAIHIEYALFYNDG